MGHWVCPADSETCLIRTVKRGCAAETEIIREAGSLRRVYELTCLQCALWSKAPFPHSCARPRTNAVEKDGGCSLKAKAQKKKQEKKLEVSRCNREDVNCLSLTVQIINCSPAKCLLMTCAAARYIPSSVCGSPGGEAQYQSETDREQFPRQHFHNIKRPLFVSFAATARFGWSRRGSPSQGTPRFAITDGMAAAAAAATNKNHFLAKLWEAEVNKRLLRERNLLHHSSGVSVWWPVESSHKFNP